MRNLSSEPTNTESKVKAFFALLMAESLEWKCYPTIEGSEFI